MVIYTLMHYQRTNPILEKGDKYVERITEPNAWYIYIYIYMKTIIHIVVNENSDT